MFNKSPLTGKTSENLKNYFSEEIEKKMFVTEAREGELRGIF